MPSPYSFRDIVRQQFKDAPVASSLQMEALEQQCQILRRHMKNFTLDQLGGIACLDSGDGMCHGLYRDSPFIDPASKWSLQTQGIFAGTPFARRGWYKPAHTKKLLCPDAYGVYKTFGLARSGEWLYIEIDYALRGATPNIYERAVHIRIAESTLPEIVEKTGISLGNIFHFLVIRISNWVHARKQLYEEAVGFEKLMEFEFELFNAINGS